jgi:hypothetical protein
MALYTFVYIIISMKDEGEIYEESKSKYRAKTDNGKT